MKIKFLENGINSLETGYNALIEYEELYYFKNSKKKERYFKLKSAILSIHHGVEILLKYCLLLKNELLIFPQIDENLKKAFREKKSQGLQSVFETSLKHKIHTITYLEVISRLQVFGKIEIKKEFIDKLHTLANFRNLITHSEVYIDEIDISNTFNGLIDELDFFFLSSIGKRYKPLSGHKNLIKNYAKYKESLNNNNLKLKAESLDFALTLFKELDITIGENDVKRITDINKATYFFNELIKSKFRLGGDFYNWHCFGSLSSIKRIDNHCFMMIANRGAAYIFKFRSLIFLQPEICNNESPLIFIESDDITNLDNSLIPHIIKDDSIKYLRGICYGDDEKITFNPKEIEAFDSIKNEDDEDPEEEDDYFDLPKNRDVFKFLTKGICCGLNIQGLSFSYLREVIRHLHHLDGKELETSLRREIKETSYVLKLK